MATSALMGVGAEPALPTRVAKRIKIWLVYAAHKGQGQRDIMGDAVSL